MQFLLAIAIGLALLVLFCCLLVLLILFIELDAVERQLKAIDEEFENL